MNVSEEMNFDAPREVKAAFDGSLNDRYFFQSDHC